MAAPWEAMEGGRLGLDGEKGRRLQMRVGRERGVGYKGVGGRGGG
jgi:hypothetical protein